jgi:nitrate reductase gamma subunit
VEALLEFLSGPVFRLAIVVAVLGTAAQYVQNAMVIARSSTDWKKGFRDTISAMITWVNPADRIRRRGFLGELLTWIVLAGVLVVPLFYLGHARLIGRNLFLEWPVVPAQISDLLTKLTMIALVLLLIVRLADHSFRRDMRRLDWMPMILALTAFVSGYLVAHPGRSPMSPDNTALIHYVSADALLLIAPFTRLARCVLLPGAYQGAVQHRQEVAS